MGVSGAAGSLLGILLIVPLQLLTGKLMSKNNDKISASHDQRLARSTEMVQGMKTVKLSCIESKILERINEARCQFHQRFTGTFLVQKCYVQFFCN